jgi:GntP family gluconate:H+ symporter
MALIASIIGIPMFFEIGLVLLIPVVLLAVYRTKSPAMLLGIPALAGLSVLHGFIPPHPGPLAAIGILHANVGITLAFGLVVAVPAVIVAGPLFGRVAARMVPIGAAGAGFAITGQSADTTADTSFGSTSGGTAAGTSFGTTSHGGSGQQRASQAVATQDPTSDSSSAQLSSAQDLVTQDPEATGRPSFTWTLITLLLPLVLMLIKAAADLLLPAGNALRSFLDFVGDPVVALLAGVLLAMITFGTKVGFSATVLSKKISDSLLPIVGVVFIVGAGGGFKQELVDGGASTAIAKLATDAGLSALLLGWLVAVLIRLATGSATVATVTAAGIIAPLAVGLSQPNLALVVLAIGAGSLFFSHVNDAGFWLVKEYFGLSVGQTIKTWSVMETIISVIGLGMTALLSVFV